jgi:hypothetical protein
MFLSLSNGHWDQFTSLIFDKSLILATINASHLGEFFGLIISRRVSIGIYLGEKGSRSKSVLMRAKFTFRWKKIDSLKE